MCGMVSTSPLLVVPYAVLRRLSSPMVAALSLGLEHAIHPTACPVIHRRERQRSCPSAVSYVSYHFRLSAAVALLGPALLASTYTTWPG